MSLTREEADELIAAINAKVPARNSDRPCMVDTWGDKIEVYPGGCTDHVYIKFWKGDEYMDMSLDRDLASTLIGLLSTARDQIS